MKVLHAPWVIAGISGVLAKAQRALGVEAESYAITSTSFQYSVDRTLDENKNPKLQILQNVLRLGWHYDVFHFYYNGSLLGHVLKDVPLLRKVGKRIFFHFCGCDLRDSKAVIAKYAISACKECWPMLCSPHRDRTVEIAQKYANAAFVATPDLLEFYDGSILLLNPIDLQSLDLSVKLWEKEERNNFRKPHSTEFVRIVHAPSSQTIKGTKYIIAAVDELRKAGYAVELKLIERVSNQEALRMCWEADLAIDQVLVGSYGQFAIEMMALGKPVICYIREDLERYYPKNLPIVRANPKDLAQVLAKLLEHPKMWVELGCQGREYVERHHEAHVIARQSVEVYHQYE